MLIRELIKFVLTFTGLTQREPQISLNDHGQSEIV